MKPDIEITDEIAKRVYGMYYAKMPTTDYISGVAAMKDALEAALNPPIVLCKNCGKSLSCHALVTVWGTGFRACPGAVWDPAS